jgi:glycosyltransferase involved in cell wall biosynthesis
MKTALTVALCTYNPRPDPMARAVRSIASQLDDVAGAELLIVDNNSDQPLSDADYLQGLRLEIVRESRQGLTAARATAIHHARGDVVLFVDDDNVLAPGYLRGAAAAFADPKLGVLGGRIVPEYESHPPRWLGPFEPQLAIRRFPLHLVVETTGLPYTDYFPVGAGSAVRRDLALDYVADAETRGRIEGRRGRTLSSGEDLDLDLFALNAGRILKVTGALSLTHLIPASRCTEDYMARLVTGHVRSAAEVDRKWSAVFGKPIFDFLHAGESGEAWRLAALAALAPFSAAHRIKRARWREIRRVRRETLQR